MLAAVPAQPYRGLAGGVEPKASTHGDLTAGQAPTSKRAKRATSSFSPTVACTALIA